MDECKPPPAPRQCATWHAVLQYFTSLYGPSATGGFASYQTGATFGNMAEMFVVMVNRVTLGVVSVVCWPLPGTNEGVIL